MDKILTLTDDEPVVTSAPTESSPFFEDIFQKTQQVQSIRKQEIDSYIDQMVTKLVETNRSKFLKCIEQQSTNGEDAIIIRAKRAQFVCDNAQIAAIRFPHDICEIMLNRIPELLGFTFCAFDRPDDDPKKACVEIHISWKKRKETA